MRTLALLTTLLFLALQTQARTLQETADQVPSQDARSQGQPEAKDQGDLWAEDQDQAGDDDQDVAISFTGEERLARGAGETSANLQFRSVTRESFHPNLAGIVCGKWRVHLSDLHEAGCASPLCLFPTVPDPPLPSTEPGTGTYCYCTLKKYCNFPEKKSGSCKLYNRRRKLCCR
ncbi:LOW QUALITY PROTEIN: defensin-5 [Pipistrellus kuhlii]|uniref:LOW QUALITY PROTEIN: defensin-5 n=1 Tax=Pipistrellus kuhlii TaxID=59472 RepID=UPI00174F1DB3|nr:LOW QUALITY PROTEIN: defensin-5 [Pipistrellus kuhlii]